MVRLVVDLVAEPPPRLPDPEALEAEILRVRLPRLASAAGDGIATIALDALRGLSVTAPT